MQLKNIFLPMNSIFLLSSLSLINSCDETSMVQWNGSSSVNCGGGRCVTVGAYNLDGTDNISGGTNDSRRAFAAFSRDGGQTFFSDPQIVMPSNNISTDNSQLSSVTCMGQRCIATGAYNLFLKFASPFSVHAEPLIAISHDSGETFTYTTSVALPGAPNPDTLSFISGITCTDNNCVGVGIYNYQPLLGTPPSPLTIMSQNGGRTFVATQPSLPLDHKTPIASTLAAVSCVDKNCVAVGDYTNTLNVQVPLVLFSQDNGRTFTKAFSPALPNNPVSSSSAEAQLYGITCNNKNRCIGVGAYNIGAPASTPASAFIILSDDGGQTFTQSFSPKLPDDALPNRSALLKGISCIDNTCTAVGTYNLDSTSAKGQPLVLVSHNFGATFSPVAQPSLPIGSVDPTLTEQLTGVSCSYYSCVAVGGYNMEIQNTNPKFGKPLTMWKNTYHNAFSSASVPTLPEGANSTLGAGFGNLNIP